jgi:hypothetical protein
MIAIIAHLLLFFSQVYLHGRFSMNPESVHEPENDFIYALEFGNPTEPDSRAVNRTTTRIDGFSDKLEPRRDRGRGNNAEIRGWRIDNYWENN